MQHVEEAKETPEADTGSQTNGQIKAKMKPTNKVRGREVANALTTDAETKVGICKEESLRGFV